MACSEEVFGPVMAVAAFTTDDEAVALANDCPFGLGSSVFSRNTARAQRLGSRIEVRGKNPVDARGYSTINYYLPVVKAAGRLV